MMHNFKKLHLNFYCGGKKVMCFNLDFAAAVMVNHALSRKCRVLFMLYAKYVFVFFM